MGIFDLLAEARIKEWQKRAPDQKDKGAEETLTITGPEPLEVQLFKEIIALHKSAHKATEQVERHELLSKASGLQTQLMVVLEQSGRPLAARQVTENIRLHLSGMND